MPSTQGTPGSNWAAALQASRGAGLAPAASDDPLMALVYLGTGVRGGGVADDTPQGFGSTGSTPATSAPAETTIDDLLSQFEDMGLREQRRLALLLTIGGYAGSVSLEDAGKAARDLTLNETLNAYLELLDDAAGRYFRGQKITPEQLLEQNVAYRLPRNADWDGSYSGLVDILGENDIDVSGVEPVDEPKDLSGTRTTTSSNTSVSRDIMDPNDAMALTRAMLQRELGRDPTKGEFEDFVSAVQAAQRRNPTRTHTTQTNTVTTNKKGRVVDSDTSSSSTTTGGITQAGVEDLMLRKARANPDWAEWQAVGTYAPALFQALGATVPGV
jgi:hypothetical protein